MKAYRIALVILTLNIALLNKVLAQNYIIKPISLKDYKVKKEYVWKDSHKNKIAFLYYFNSSFKFYAVASGLKTNLTGDSFSTIYEVEKLPSRFHVNFGYGLTYKINISFSNPYNHILMQ